MKTAKYTSELDDTGGGMRPALAGSALFVVLCGLVYPAVATVLGGVLFPHQANGSLVELDGRVVGSALVAQPFADVRYFRPRPSAANYDPTALSGSNLASSNPALRERMAADSAAVAVREGAAPADIPGELVTASGSGIDPHLSPAAARLQAARVAKARGLPVDAVNALIHERTERRTLGVLGEPRVNVLELNLALDERGAKR